MKWLLLIPVVVIFVGWFLMVVGHAACVRECYTFGHLWERFTEPRGDNTFLMCNRCGRRA